MTRLFQRLSLARKTVLGIVPLFLLFVSLSVALHNHFQERELMEQAQAAARMQAEIIRESMLTMMVNDYRIDDSFLRRVNDLEGFDSLHIAVGDLRFREDLLTEERALRVESRREANHPHDSLEWSVLRTGTPIFRRNGDHFRAIVPFNSTSVCRKCHEVPEGATLGVADMHVSLARISSAAAASWKRSLLIFIAFSILAIALASFTFRRYVSRPIDSLIGAARTIGEGNLDRPIPGASAGEASGRSRDELHFLASRFDAMRIALREKIDRLRRTQEELVRSERLAVTATMTAQLSHEINNPIHNIQSLLESTVRKLDPDSPARELVTVALEEVNRTARLTRQMLDFYRSSVVEFEKTPVDLRDLLLDLVKSNEDALGRQQVTLSLELPGRLPAVRGSYDKLKQVFLNLILNARDAMPAGGSIRIGAQSTPGRVRIDVSDTGTGIRPEHRNRIFEAFFTTKQEVSGVGLGLAVSYGIVQQHNGTITVESTLGEGSTFTVELPTEGNA